MATRGEAMETPLLQKRRSCSSFQVPPLTLKRFNFEGDEHNYSVFSHQTPVFHTSLHSQSESPLPSPKKTDFPFAFDEETQKDVGKEASEPQERSASAVAVHALVFGLINFIVCVPTLISYAAIVFRLPRFGVDMPSLTKLFFLSSAVHQLIFTAASSLNFAVGQVQDVGLIFLSQIASAVFARATQAGAAYREALATVLVASAGATALTGAAVWLVGRLRLSGYIQLLPLPVVGGYLGYIGYFCLAAGAELGTGRTVVGFGTWGQFLVCDPVLLSKLALSLAFAICLFYTAYKINRVAALPAVLVATPIVFFVVLLVFGIPLEDARAGGWIPFPDPQPTAGWQCLRLFNGFEGIAWSALPAQLQLVVGLFCVVSFGSVLDIAAIQTEQPTPLDFDGELRMIGLSNVASGLAGGFTGSYIFSQVIFSQRQGVGSRINGWVVAIGEFLLFLAPLDVLQFFPGFYIGGIMAFFGIDIMLDWLVHSRHKVSRWEYVLLLSTFVFVMFSGVIGGCALGVAANAAVFLVVFGRTPVVEIRPDCASTAMRSADERAALLQLRERIVCVELRGFLFFGAALQVSDQLIRELRSREAAWVVLDFTHVLGLDSSSARALSKLVSMLRADGRGLAVCTACRRPQSYELLKENGALPVEADLDAGLATFEDNIDEALAWCERGALRAASVGPPTWRLGSPSKYSPRAQLRVLLAEYLHPLHEKASTVSSQDAPLLEELAGKFSIKYFGACDLVFDSGDASDGFFMLFEGEAYSDRPSIAEHGASVLKGKFTFEPGALLGEVDYQLGRPRSYRARAGTCGCRCAAITRDELAALEWENPRLAIFIHRILLRSVCLLADTAHVLHVR